MRTTEKSTLRAITKKTRTDRTKPNYQKIVPDNRHNPNHQTMKESVEQPQTRANQNKLIRIARNETGKQPTIKKSILIED